MLKNLSKLLENCAIKKDCQKCLYHEGGCVNYLMLDAADALKDQEKEDFLQEAAALKPITNFDRITASPETVKDLIMHFCFESLPCEYCAKKEKKKDCFMGCFAECEDGVAEWLNQEVEG